MKRIMIALALCVAIQSLKAQVSNVPTTYFLKVEPSGFTGSAGNYTGNLVSPNNQTSKTTFNLSQIQVGDVIMSGSGHLYSVTVINGTPTTTSANVTVVRINQDGIAIAPTGFMNLARPTSIGLIPTSTVNTTGLPPVVEAYISNYNWNKLNAYLQSLSSGATTRSANITKTDNTANIDLSSITPTVTTVLQVAVNGLVVEDTEWNQSGQTLIFVDNGTGNSGIPPSGSLISIIYN